MGEIKKFNVKIQGQSDQTFNVGANATNVYFSDNAISPFENKPVEGEVSNALSNKAQNNIYGNAYIRNNAPNKIDGIADNSASCGKDYTSKDGWGSGGFSISYGLGSIATGHNASAIGFDCEALGWASHAEGWKTNSMGNYSHAEGAYTIAGHNIAHVEGDATQATGHASHAEGMGGRQPESKANTGGGAQGIGSHTEGIGNSIYAVNGITRNNDTMKRELDNPFGTKNGQGSHAEGISNVINGGVACHAEGTENTINQVYASSVAGRHNTVSRDYCLIAGAYNTVESESSFAFGSNLHIPEGYKDCMFIGRYSNISSGGKPPALIIGAGDANTKSNLITAYYPSSGAASQTNKGELWAQNVDAHFSTLHVDSIDNASNKWIHVGWDFSSQAYSKNYPEGTDGFVLPNAALSIWINEEDKLLHMFFRPFRNGSWNTKGVSTLRGFNAGTKKDGYVPYAGNYTSAEDSAAPQKIIDALKKLHTTFASSVYVNSSYKAFACTFWPKKLFALDGNIQNHYFHMRSLTVDLTNPKDLQHYALDGDMLFEFTFPYD